jgi:hypothetical protein
MEFPSRHTVRCDQRSHAVDKSKITLLRGEALQAKQSCGQPRMLLRESW